MIRLPSETENQTVGPDENRLIQRHLNGDRDAFAELMNRYRKPVYTYLVRWGVPPDARDDLFQEIFLKIHTASQTYRPEKPLFPWLFAIVANTVRSEYRKTRVRRIVYGEIPETADADAPGPHKIAEAGETVRWPVRWKKPAMPFPGAMMPGPFPGSGKRQPF